MSTPVRGGRGSSTRTAAADKQGAPGRRRWVVERTHWFAGLGKLRIRFKRRFDIHTLYCHWLTAVIRAGFVDDLC
jgi:hypothetical protein